MFLKKNNNYIGQTSTVLLAKQSLLRILCDTKHHKKEMLLSKLKEFSRVNDELQVLLGKRNVATLKDYRDHRQFEVSIKEKKIENLLDKEDKDFTYEKNAWRNH